MRVDGHYRCCGCLAERLSSEDGLRRHIARDRSGEHFSSIQRMEFPPVGRAGGGADAGRREGTFVVETDM